MFVAKFDDCKIESQPTNDYPGRNVRYDTIAKVVFTQQLYRISTKSNIPAHRIVDIDD